MKPADGRPRAWGGLLAHRGGGGSLSSRPRTLHGGVRISGRKSNLRAVIVDQIARESRPPLSLALLEGQEQRTAGSAPGNPDKPEAWGGAGPRRPGSQHPRGAAVGQCPSQGRALLSHTLLCPSGTVPGLNVTDSQSHGGPQSLSRVPEPPLEGSVAPPLCTALGPAEGLCPLWSGAGGHPDRAQGLREAGHSRDWEQCPHPFPPDISDGGRSAQTPRGRNGRNGRGTAHSGRGRCSEVWPAPSQAGSSPSRSRCPLAPCWHVARVDPEPPGDQR